ncbi:leucine-rich repeat neuronal protein 2 [Hyalella azteca]|uniref:Leucine-rich repeat neuronal protein 2 n=2 Tax=Hyalella azteca TaxID=294128 RepID=A0A8B7NJV1_HYAAZ|nr:leucine-rich repeat neuronal protein 2 [Hyalella azteca]
METRRYMWLLTTFMTSMFSIHGISQALPENYNPSCPQPCICGLRRSNYFQRDMKTLDCSFSGLTDFPPLPSSDVEVMNAKGNTIANVDRSIAKLTQLKELDLSGNQIKSIGRGKMFRNLTNLIYFNVGKNEISTIFHDTFLGPINIKQLVLSNNNINYIEDEAFTDLKKLEILDLEQNLLGSLYEEWFTGLSKLLSLNLAHNRVHNVPASVFRPLQNLRSLFLAGNRISSIDPRAFSGLTKLQELTLNDNLLSRVPTAALQSMPQLDSVVFDHNPVPKIKPLDFSHLSVSKISICQMPELVIIDAKAFYTLRNLTNLLIKNNKRLSYVDPLAFINVNNLRELNLAYNNLQGIQREMADFLPDGVRIHLYGNPLNCNCNSRWLRIILNPNLNSTLHLEEPEHLVCNSPANFNHKLLKDIDLVKLPKKCTPIILNLTQKSELVGKVGEKEILECRAMGSPPPKLHWSLPDGSNINSTLNEVRRRYFPPGTLVYYHLQPTDAGLFRCIAENSAGRDTAIIKLTVTGIDIHLFPIAVSSTFVTLVWNGTERRAFPQYKIVYGIDDGKNGTIPEETQFAMASQSRKTYTISRLRPDTKYRFCIGYEDASGYWLQISCCLTITQDAKFMLQGISRPNNVAAVAIGLVLLLALVLCLASLASRRYRQRFYENTDKTNTNIGDDSTPNASTSTAVSSSGTIALDNLYRPLLHSS